MNILSGAVSFSGGKRTVNAGFPARFMLCVCDGIFCLTVASVFPIFTYAVNNGDFRYFMAVGCAVGYAIYHATVGKLVLAGLGAVANAVRVVITYTVLKPVGFIARILWKAARFVFRCTILRIINAIHNKILSFRSEKIRRQIKTDIRFDRV